MSSIKERILYFIKEKGYSKSEFYRLTGITRGVLDKESGLTEANIAKFIAAFPEVQLNWLIKGVGFVQSQDIAQSDSVSESNEQYSLSYNMVPLLSQKGFLDYFKTDTEIEILDHYMLPEFEHADCLLRVQGNDMSPSYNSGDLLICKVIENQGFIQWGRVHVILTKTSGLILRKAQPSTQEGYYTLSSGNESFPNFDISEEEIDSIAIVLGVISMG